MNPAALHMLLQLPPDPIVYWAEVRTGQGVETMKPDVSRLSSCAMRSLTRSVGRSIILTAIVSSGSVTALINLMETEILCR